MLCTAATGLAQTVAPASPGPSAAKAVPAPSKPEWSALTAAQKVALAPLQPTWNSLGVGQKRKWIALSANYAKLSEPEKATLHERMAVWAALGTELRSTARLNYAEAQAMPAVERKAQWEAYQALSPEEKRKLTAEATGKPPAAARAVKPVSPEKLAVVPTTRSDVARPAAPASAAGVPRPSPVRPARPASSMTSTP